MAYFDTVIPSTAQGYWYNFFKANVPTVSGWDIWDDIEASYQIVFRCQHPTYGTFYFELNDMADTNKLYFRVWEVWDNVNHVGDTSHGYTSQAYIGRAAGRSIRLYVNDKRIIVGDRNGQTYYGGFLQRPSALDNPYLIAIGQPSAVGASYNPLATCYGGMVYSLAKNHLGQFNVAVRTDIYYYDTPNQAIHRITPAGYVIITPTFIVENTTSAAGKCFGTLDGVSGHGGRVGFENGDVSYDEENLPWDAYMINNTSKFGCWVRRA